MKKLSRQFFLRNSVSVAKSLIGKYIIKRDNGVMLAGRIIETEAYRGRRDPGSHTFRKRTKRNEVMFGKPGIAYVYLCYGNHFLFNAVTEKEGEAGAVLIRALEPVSGLALMMKRRRTKEAQKLTNGPGKWTKAFGIDKRHNKLDLITAKNLYIASGRNEKHRIIAGPRIGIKQGLDRKWRFYIKDSKFISV